MSYISASTNRHPCAADISGVSLVAFASSTLVALWDTASDRGVFETLAAHEGLVTCVRFVTDDLLATADDKGELRCWRRNGSQACRPRVIAALKFSNTAPVEIDRQN